MKKAIASLLLAASATPLHAQKPGDTVTPEALGKLEWVKGEAPKAWEPGKVYILECWATWCGPCVAAIPHVDELYDKYSEKGLRVIGVNVWEDGKDKVSEFVTKKGDGMSYPVAYTGKGGPFESEWLKPAGVRGIPHAFVVKDGKVILTSHPMQLSSEVIEGLLAGGEAETKVLASIEEAKKKQEEATKAINAFRKAAAAKDAAEMEKSLEALKALDPKSAALPSLNMQLLVVKGDWAAVEAGLKEMKVDPSYRMMVAFAAQRSVKDDKAPEAFKKSIAEEFARIVEEKGQPFEFQVLAGVQWARGEKEAATASAKRAAETAKVLGQNNKNFPVAPYERFAEAVERGELPSNEQVNEWTREAMREINANASSGG